MMYIYSFLCRLAVQSATLQVVERILNSPILSSQFPYSCCLSEVYHQIGRSACRRHIARQFEVCTEGLDSHTARGIVQHIVGQEQLLGVVGRQWNRRVVALEGGIALRHVIYCFIDGDTSE